MAQPETPEEDDPVPGLVANAIEALIGGDRAVAERAIGAIDTQRLRDDRRERRIRAMKRGNRQAEGGPREGRMNPSPADRERVFGRDRYTCRYCGRRTIDLEVLKGLSQVIPEALPYEPSWAEAHPIYWTHSASFEHVQPLARGGTNEDANLVTACYCCNDIKNDSTLDELGWTRRPRTETDWDGLSSHLKDLRRLLPPRPGRSTAPSTPSQIPLDVGGFVRAVLPGNKQARSYRVDAKNGDDVALVEMWRAGGVWVASTKQRRAAMSGLERLEVIAAKAPEVGSTA